MGAWAHAGGWGELAIDPGEAQLHVHSSWLLRRTLYPPLLMTTASMPPIRVLALTCACVVLSSIAGTAAAADGDGEKPKMPKFDGFDGLGGDKFCPPYRCPKGLEAGPRRGRVKLSSTGCSNMGGIAMLSGGGAKKDEAMRPCCDRKNACYQICGSSRSHCDETFKKCTADACAAIKDDEQKRKDCEQEASMKTMMAGLSGCKEYDAGQAAACECAAKGEKVAELRRGALEKFYKKHNPAGLDKVDNLAAKADAPVKFAALFQKLVAKYPDSIQKVKDPNADWMDRIMKEAEEKKDDGGDAGVEDESEGTVDEGVEDLDGEL